MKTTSLVQFTVLTLVLDCVTSRSLLPPKRRGYYANFVVANGKGVGEEGLIMNAALSWGKWRLGGRDVTTVNNIGFNSDKSADFMASGRSGSPSGTEGTFEIHEAGKKVAIVEFSIPFWGKNELKIRDLDDQFVCNQRGFTTNGSPTININCHKKTR